VLFHTDEFKVCAGRLIRMSFTRLAVFRAIVPALLCLVAFNATGQAGSPKGPLSPAALRELEAEVRKQETEAKAAEQQAQRAEGQARAKAETAVRAADKDHAAAEKREREETARIAKATKERQFAEEKRAKEEAAARYVPFGSIAVGTKVINHGEARDADSQEAAEQLAMEHCQHTGDTCTVVLTWAGQGCGAFRASKDGEVQAWGVKKMINEAASAAFDEASKLSKGQATNQVAIICNMNKSRASLDTLVQKPANIGGPTECLVQFEGNFYDGKGDWDARFYSPVYQLKGSDCPRKVGEGEHDVYFHAFPPSKTSASEREKALKLDPTGRGQRMAEEFRIWMATKRSPAPGTVIHNVVSATFTYVKPKPMKDLVENVSVLDAGMKSSRLRSYFPLCFDFKPSGVTPTAVHGAQYCRNWIR
jgi:hypothetical protein